MNILFLTPYPLKESPSQRFRFEQYFDFIIQHGHTFTSQSFLDSRNWRFFFKSGKLHKKAFALLKGFLKRIVILAQLDKYDIIFIHREITPLGPPVFEWVIAKILKKKIVYDFDDAIWMTDRSDESAWLSLIKWRGKVKHICRWSYKVSCGNAYLCDYARQYNEMVTYNPTTIDTENLHRIVPKAIHQATETVTIGWTGSHSTLKYLEQIEPVLKKLEQKYPQIRLMIIADRVPRLDLKSMIFKPWNIETEIEDLWKFDIGIMPLPNDEWSKGKCGFKALQYMALEIPTVAASVGVNPTIIDHGSNGFLASTETEWEDFISRLVRDHELRTLIGKQGRKKIIDQFSVASNVKVFLSLFE